eukprot:4808070-Alexandrium_andersonii.AAC.1
MCIRDSAAEARAKEIEEKKAKTKAEREAKKLAALNDPDQQKKKWLAGVASLMNQCDTALDEVCEGNHVH